MPVFLVEFECVDVAFSSFITCVRFGRELNAITPNRLHCCKFMKKVQGQTSDRIEPNIPGVKCVNQMKSSLASGRRLRGE